MFKCQCLPIPVCSHCRQGSCAWLKLKAAVAVTVSTSAWQGDPEDGILMSSPQLLRQEVPCLLVV